MAAGRKSEPPPDLVKLWDWRDLHTPPVHGGLDDQPAGLLQRARYLEAVVRVMYRFYHHQSYTFDQSERAILETVLRLRKERNASQ